MEESTFITARFANESELIGTVVGKDELVDLAYIRLNSNNSFTPVSLGNSDALSVGDDVVALGFPLAVILGGSPTVTRGVVSAKRTYGNVNFLQTDAPINPGNSGGPLVDAEGRVIGVNTAKISQLGGENIEGIGLAISINEVKTRMAFLGSGGVVTLPTPTLVPGPTPSTTTSKLFGPISGELRHDPSDGLIKGESAGVSMADMVVEATFVNPYSAASNPWDYGFSLRHKPYGSQDPTFHLVVTSDRRWALTARADATFEHIGGGTLKLNTDAGGWNHLRVVAIGERGWLFVNGEFVSTLDLSAVSSLGDVAVITGQFIGDEVAGAVTRFQEFRGTALAKRYGPAEGKLQKEPGFIAFHESGVWARDSLVEAQFVNPQGINWDYGFVIRNPEFNRLEVIGVSGQGRWFHYSHDVGDADYVTKASSLLATTGVSLLNRNRLIIIAIEESGWFYVNDRLIGKLDLGHNLDYGGISAMCDFFLTHNGEPRFESFNVWVP